MMKKIVVKLFDAANYLLELCLNVFLVIAGDPQVIEDSRMT